MRGDFSFIRLPFWREMLDELVVADVKVLRERPRSEPDERGRNSLEDEGADFVTLGGGEPGVVLRGYDEMQQVLFALELVAKSADGAAELVWLDSDIDERIKVGGSLLARVKIGEFDANVFANVIEETVDDFVSAMDFLLGGSQGHHKEYTRLTSGFSALSWVRSGTIRGSKPPGGDPQFCSDVAIFSSSS